MVSSAILSAEIAGKVCVVSIESKSIRFDYGGISTQQRQVLPDGRVICEGVFARDGILVYRQPNGSHIRELRLPETNRDSATLTTYGASPITDNHPSEMVTKHNAKRLAVGFSDRQVVYDNGFLRGIVMLHDGDAIDRVDSGKVQLSPGYICDVEHKSGEWKGQRYDRIQRNVKTNHIAIVDIGRNGPDVRLHWDSADQDIAALVQEVEESDPALYFDFGRRTDSQGGLIMPSATRTIQIGTFRWDGVPGDLADKVSELMARENKLDAAIAENDELQSKLDDAEEKLDAQNEILREQHQKLTEAGFVLDDDGVYQRADMKGMKGMKPGEEEQPEAAAPETAPQETPAPAAAPVAHEGKQKAEQTKKAAPPAMEPEEEEEKMDGLEARVDAWFTAEMLVPGIRQSRFDSSLSVLEIQRMTIDALQPDMEYSDSQVPGIFFALSNGLTSGGSAPRTDAAGVHADRLDSAISRTNYVATRRAQEERVDDGDEGVDESWSEPLALTL